MYRRWHFQWSQRIGHDNDAFVHYTLHCLEGTIENTCTFGFPSTPPASMSAILAIIAYIVLLFTPPSHRCPFLSLSLSLLFPNLRATAAWTLSSGRKTALQRLVFCIALQVDCTLFGPVESSAAEC